jgi:hypothetical protein
MNTDGLTNPTVRAAVDALQKGDHKAWAALFEPDATLYDDARPRNLANFTKDALGHERFTSIERVDNNGLEVVGEFHLMSGVIFAPTSSSTFPLPAR